MTQIYLNPYRPEKGELQALRKLSRNYRATYHQYQSIAELTKATVDGRWVAIEAIELGSTPVQDMDWPTLMHDRYAQEHGLHLVTGSMNHGLPPEILEMMDAIVSVPQFDDVPFLAPASAAAITLHEIFTQTIVPMRAGR